MPCSSERSPRPADGMNKPSSPPFDKPKSLSWSQPATEAFETLKKAFTTAPLLVHPNPDLPFVVEVDASTTGLNPAEVNYDIGDRELLAVKLALEEWRHWLEGANHPFQVLTDHKNLEYLKAAKRLNPCQARWAMFFSRFNFSISYRPGSKNLKADALSRLHAPEEKNDDPETILPESIFMSPIEWSEETLPSSNASSRTPPGCPQGLRYITRTRRTPLLHSVHSSLGTGIISTTAAESRSAVSSVLDCELDNDTYICTGAQYRMYCNLRMHHFSYQRYQNQNQYQCMSNNCICVGNKDTCTCYKNTSSCFCENVRNNLTIPTAVSPVYDCGRYNDMYICTGARYNMYCNTSVHDFHYSKNHYHCFDDFYFFSNNCVGDKDTCTCSSSTLSSCFCTNYNNSITIPAAVTPVYDCGLYNDTYICTGAQQRMYCNTRMHSFNYQRYRYLGQYQYECWGNNCYCVGDKDTCTCYSSTLSSCFCETLGNNISVPTAVSPVTDPDCVLQNNMYICTGAQYRMYCNTQMHDFSYENYQFQHQYQCVNNNCDCVGNKDTCTCSSSTLSSCFCETYGNTIALTTAVTPVYDCVLYNDTYICTGAQYSMYCNTRTHYFFYQRYRYLDQNQYQCWSDNCNCIGNKDTCTCYYNMSSSCFCTNYNNSIIIPAAVSPVYDCGLYNGTYICTGAQYRMFCNTSVHDFHYDTYHSHCFSDNCYCIGYKDTCTCYSSTLSSCFCETYGNIVALNRAVAPAYGCVLYNDTYICTGAQYHMYCNTRINYFYYWKNQYQDQYLCMSYDCFCFGHKDTCTCYSSTLSSCFCETYNNSVTIPTAVSPLRLSQCVLFNDMYICFGAQYHMYCNTSVHDFYYLYQNPNQYQYGYQCWGDNCACMGNYDTCTCYSRNNSSCFCEDNISSSSLDNMLDQCRSQTCFQNLLDIIEIITNQELPLNTVTEFLTMAINTSENILESSSSVSPAELASYGNRVLKASEKLISTLVKPTDTSANVSFTLPTVEGQVFMVGPHVTLDKIPRLDTTSSSVDIDLIGIAKNNKGSAAVAFLSYNTMENLLKPDFFNTSNDTVKTMMSTVISVTLPKTTNTKLTKPVNFTLKHIRDSNPSGSLSCVYWNTSEWIVDGCAVLETNSSYTVCSCVHLSTFTLVQTSSSSQSNPPLDLLTWVSVILGLLFLSVGLLIFALCRWTRMSDWICGHSRCVRLVPEGYVRELSGSSTRSASDVFDVDSKPSTSKVSQEKHCNIMLSLEHVNQNTNTSA
ncbi:uncharacterized protein LOC125255188 [Megalobrama amblycephala]|uniref:uncharacterized protein LOC125255188 n=1 Tax=Megalobrama amblycephala TaxID=75352 RepID=UPI0020141823|nr:uncharacterized protein LOC125255188 [Megalobrama amblycephala]